MFLCKDFFSIIKRSALQQTWKTWRNYNNNIALPRIPRKANLSKQDSLPRKLLRLGLFPIHGSRPPLPIEYSFDPIAFLDILCDRCIIVLFQYDEVRHICKIVESEISLPQNWGKSCTTQEKNTGGHTLQSKMHPFVDHHHLFELILLL